MKKLLIWDFDGVISDTEKLWVASRLELLNRDYHLGWNFDTAKKYIGGRSDKDKKEVLRKMGLSVSDDLWNEAYQNDIERIKKGLFLTPYIENIFKMKNIDQCIATGGIWEKTKEKVYYTGISSYFSDEKVFTVDFVKRGKPAPDLFLYAAKSMGYRPQDCVVIEDSVVGLTAALRAKMTPIAFIKYDTSYDIAEIKKLGVPYIFSDMRDIKRLLKDLLDIK